MNQAEENYVHFTECIESLTSSWHILKELESVAPGVIRGAAYRMALVEYAKPYKVSFGAHRGRKGYVIPAPKLSADEIRLHTQLLGLRDQVLAHSDLTLKDARVYASRVNGKPLVAIGAKQVPSFPNPVSVIALIERSLDLMYVQLELLDEAIAPKT